MPEVTANFGLALVVFIAGRLNTLSGRRVGITATKGIFFRLVREALRQGSEPLFRQWLTHSRPQVRALGLVCLCLRQPPNLESTVAPLLSDKAKVRIRPVGCVETEQTLGYLAKRLFADPTYFGHRSDLKR